MKPWILLLITLGLTFMTYESFLLCGIIKNSPYKVLLKALGMIDTHVSLSEQERTKSAYQIKYATSVPFVFLMGMIIFGISTYRAFFP